MATVLVFANQKGGVAKTTSCVNLGAGLALRGHRTLLMDFDPQGSLSRYLGWRDGQSPTVGDWLLDRVAFEDAAAKTPFEHLSYVPASEALIADQSTIEQDKIKGLHFLRRKLEGIRNQFDFILIDTMPSFTTLFANALVAGDQVIVPVKLEWLSIQGLPPLISKIRDVQENVKDLQVLGILGTFYRKGVAECQKCLGELDAMLPGRVFQASIQLNSKLAEASGYGKPIQHYDRQAQGFADYEALTEEVLAKCKSNQTPAAEVH
jgi:chromosome partitioning protein